jgi:AcrR family transcriptional regulator
VERAGVDTLHLRELAREVGVSHAAPSRHFPSRDALIAAIAAEGFALLRQALIGTSVADDPLERLRAQGLAFIAFAAACPAHYRVMFGRWVPDRADFPELEQAGEAAINVLVDAIRACQKAKQLRRGDPSRMAVSAWAMVHGMATLLGDRQLVNPEPGLIREVVDTVVKGLA